MEEPRQLKGDDFLREAEGEEWGEELPDEESCDEAEPFWLRLVADAEGDAGGRAEGEAEEDEEGEVVFDG